MGSNDFTKVVNLFLQYLITNTSASYKNNVIIIMKELIQLGP